MHFLPARPHWFFSTQLKLLLRPPSAENSKQANSGKPSCSAQLPGGTRSRERQLNLRQGSVAVNASFLPALRLGCLSPCFGRAALHCCRRRNVLKFFYKEREIVQDGDGGASLGPKPDIGGGRQLRASGLGSGAAPPRLRCRTVTQGGGVLFDPRTAPASGGEQWSTFGSSDDD